LKTGRGVGFCISDASSDITFDLWSMRLGLLKCPENALKKDGFQNVIGDLS
jgi:hypothetical protein